MLVEALSTPMPETALIPVEPSSDIPEVSDLEEAAGIQEADGEELKTLRAAVAAMEEHELETALEDFDRDAPVLLEHHDYQRERFDDLFVDYGKVFEKFETLASISDAIRATLPSFKLQDEFTFLTLRGDAARFAALASQIVMWTGAVSGVGGVVGAVIAFRAAKAEYVAAKAAGAANLRNLKWAKRLKALGIGGAVIGVVGGGLGIYAAIKNAEAKRAFLEDAVTNYAVWFRDIRASYSTLKNGADEMERQLLELLVLLGIIEEGAPLTESDLDTLESYLGSAIEEGGALRASIATAKRMLCATEPLSEGQIAGFTGLDSDFVARLASAIVDDPSLCNI